MMKMNKKTGVGLLLGAFFSMHANSSFALTSCPNVQVGVNNAATPASPAIYSDCTMDIGSTEEYHLIMEVDTNTVTISTNGYSSAASNYVPPPAGVEEFGTWDGSTLYVSDMGTAYTGNCTEVTDITNGISAVDNHVYCGIIGNTLGEKVYLRGTWTGTTFTNYQILTDGAGVGIPVAQPTAVPALPVWALWLLGGITGLFGASRLRKVA